MAGVVSRSRCMRRLASKCSRTAAETGNSHCLFLSFISKLPVGSGAQRAYIMATTGEGCQDVVDRLHGRHTCPGEGTGVSVSVGTKGGGTHLPNIWNLTFSSRSSSLMCSSSTNTVRTMPFGLRFEVGISSPRESVLSENQQRMLT